MHGFTSSQHALHLDWQPALTQGEMGRVPRESFLPHKKARSHPRKPTADTCSTPHRAPGESSPSSQTGSHPRKPIMGVAPRASSKPEVRYYPRKPIKEPIPTKEEVPFQPHILLKSGLLTRPIYTAKSTSTVVDKVLSSCMIPPPAEHIMRDYTLTCLQTYEIVSKTGLPNFMSARIPLFHGLNIPAWRYALHNTNYQKASELCDMLDFGFPLGFEGSFQDLIPTFRNHPSAINHPETIEEYLRTEYSLLAMAGPFDTPPFKPFMISPMMTRPKNSSETSVRRTIVDLSWPPEHGINAFIPKDTFLGCDYKVQLPKVDDLVEKITMSEKPCYIYVRDLMRAYRQLRICPLSYPLMGLKYKGSYWFDTSVAFGLKTGSRHCQEVTNAISHIMTSHGYQSLNYLDDICGIQNNEDHAYESFYFLEALLSLLGIDESKHKAQEPATRRKWLGIVFDTVKRTIEVPEEKLRNIIGELEYWRNKGNATRREIQSIIGKLLHIAKCVKPARLFIGRMLCTLRRAPDRGRISLDADFRQDIKWFLDFLPSYNGVSVMKHLEMLPDHEIYLDACLTGCGAISGSHFYHVQFPEFIRKENHHISRLELLNIMVACQAFCELWKQHSVCVYCDNEAAVTVLQSGRSRDPYMLSCARQIWMFSAQYEFTVVAKHMKAEHMTLPDALSRYHLNEKFVTRCHNLLTEIDSKQVQIKNDYFQFKYAI